MAAAAKFVKYGYYLGDRLCHDDTVADFGGNDGFVANEFYKAHKVRPIVVDCLTNRLEHAEQAYGLSTCETFIESMPFRDKQVDWGFCSHTLEHCRDLGKALHEMCRVIRRGCFFVVPLEKKGHAHRNHAHAVCFRQVRQWTSLMRQAGWKIIGAQKMGLYEAQILTEPK